MGRARGPIDCTSDVARIAGSDFVLVTVKSQDSRVAMRSAAGHMGRAIVVSVQNGFNDAALGAHVPPDRLVMGMTAANMAVVAPGAVSLRLDGVWVFGPTPDRTNTEAARRAGALVRSTKLPVCEHPNVQAVRYAKLAVNAVGYASCLSGSNLITEAFGDRPWRRCVGAPLLRECRDVFRCAGVETERVPGQPSPRGLASLMALMDVPAFGSAIGWIAGQRFNRRPMLFSVSQDLARRKRTEIDFVNGEVARLAGRCQVSAPYNSLVVQLVRELETRGDGSLFTRSEVIERFAVVGQARGAS